MGEIWGEVSRYINHMGTNQWLIVAVVAIVVGFVCMRGLGTPSSY
jgi:hypothetical protein